MLLGEKCPEKIRRNAGAARMHYSYTVRLYKINMIRYFFLCISIRTSLCLRIKETILQSWRNIIYEKRKPKEARYSQPLEEWDRRADRETPPWQKNWFLGSWVEKGHRAMTKEPKSARRKMVSLAMKHLFFQTWNSYSAWKNAQNFLHWWSVYIFLQVLFHHLQAYQAAIISPGQWEKHISTNVF